MIKPLLTILALLVLVSSAAEARLLQSAEVRIRIGTPNQVTITPATHSISDPTPTGYSTPSGVVSLLPSASFWGIDSPLIQIQGSPQFDTRLGIAILGNETGIFEDGASLAGGARFRGGMCFTSLVGFCAFPYPFYFGGSEGTGMWTAQTVWGTGGSLPVTVTGTESPWTTGMITVGGAFTTPLVATGTRMLTASGSGQVTLVTPIRFTTTGTWPGLPGLFRSGIAELELHFAPEPAFGAMLGMGALFLALRAMRSGRT